MFYRSLSLPQPGTETFFLWGPRQTGKSTLLRQSYGNAYWIDLLKADEFRRYTQNPEMLRQELTDTSPPPIVVIDEVQKVPALLDEVHWLLENRGAFFALCGSSARKVKRGHANLLGGRAVRYELFGLVSTELGEDLDINRLLNHGYLPRIYSSSRPIRLLSSYVGDYLKEEVAAEGLTRNLPAFSEFLNVAAISDTEMVNYSTIARETGVSSPTIKGYFAILTDTLLGRWLPAYKKRVKRRVITSPKFYFSDVGIVNFLAKRRGLQLGGPSYGKAFENWLFHELSAYNVYKERYADITYWRLPSGIEVDFVINHVEVAIEAKATAKIKSDHLKGLRYLAAEHPQVQRRIVVCMEPKRRRTADDIEIFPARQFASSLWEGELF